MAIKSDKASLINIETYKDFTIFLVFPLKVAGFMDWFPKPINEIQLMENYIYLSMVLFSLCDFVITLIVNLYTEWVDIMSSLEKLADGLPLVVAIAIVVYFAINRQYMHDLVDYMNENFKSHSARGLTNMTMIESFKAAKKFAFLYTACTMFSVLMYTGLPMIMHLWTKQPISSWVFMDVSKSPFVELVFLKQCLGQFFVGLAVGQLGVFFGSHSILLCGQLDLICCSLRNVRYTALLQNGVKHGAIMRDYGDIINDERHSYIYTKAVMEDSIYHYDKKIVNAFSDGSTQFDIYSSRYDEATSEALRDCAKMCQVVGRYKELFENFVSPLLVLRVVQVTLYLCTLLYAASSKFELTTVEYLAAVALDMFVYCYYGNQIILQADRLSTAAYQCSWPAMGVRPRKLLLNILLANKRPIKIRAGQFLTIDLNTFVLIIKTSFSYYTLLVNVNEH